METCYADDQNFQQLTPGAEFCGAVSVLIWSTCYDQAALVFMRTCLERERAMEEEIKRESAAVIAKGKVKLLLDKGSSQKHDLGLADTKKEPSKAEEQLMVVGSAFFHANFFSLFVSMLTGLLSLMFVPGIVTILHFTGKSDTPTLSFRSILF